MGTSVARRASADIDLDSLDEDQAVIMRPTIDRERAASYFFRANLIGHVLVTLLTVGLWLPALLFWIAGFGQWYAKKRSLELDYRLLPGRLLVSDGVFTKVRKTIPLDKVTDIGLTQNIVERWFSLWRVSVQTASSGQAAPEAVLVGLADPTEFRRGVLAQRERWLESGEVAFPPGREPVVALRPVRDLEGAAVEARLEQIERLLERIANNTELK
jgi:putative membrane protein